MRLIIFLFLLTSWIVSCNSKASETFDEEAIALNNRATEIMIANPDSALILLERATKIDNKYYPAYLNQVSLYCSMHDYDNAIKVANLGISAKPDLAEAVTFLGMLYDFTKQTDKAKEQYKKAIAIYDKRLATSDENKQYNSLTKAHALLLYGDQSAGEYEVQKLLQEYPNDSAIQVLVDFDKVKYFNEVFK